MNDDVNNPSILLLLDEKHFVSIAVGVILSYIGWWWYNRRRYYNATSSLPYPPQPPGDNKHWLWGHAKRLPRDGTHIDPTLLEISRTEMNSADVFTLKLPVVNQMIIVANPDFIHYITVSKNIHKSWTYEFATMFNKNSILRSHGTIWKQQRKTFVGGFTPTYLRSMVSVMCEKLDRLLTSIDLDASAAAAAAAAAVATGEGQSKTTNDDKSSSNLVVTTMLKRTQIFASDVIVQIGFGEDWGNAYHHLRQDEDDDDPMSPRPNQRSSLPVPLYIPNLLGYLRIALAFIGLTVAHSDPVKCTILWIISAACDLFDGYLARRLNQTSSLGVLLDIAADNILRTSFWIASIMASSSSSSRSQQEQSTSTTTTTTTLPVTSQQQFVTMSPELVLVTSCFVISLEWITMVCTQLHSKTGKDGGGAHWKTCRENDPKFIQAIFANNFRSPLGILCIYGLFGSGYVVYASHYPVLVDSIPYFSILFYVSILGRIVSMMAELWLCSGYLSMVIEEDDDSSTYSRQDKVEVTYVSSESQTKTQNNDTRHSGEDITKGRAWLSEMSRLADQRVQSPFMIVFGSRRMDELTKKMNRLLLGVLDRRTNELKFNSQSTNGTNQQQQQQPKDICSLAIASIKAEKKTDDLTMEEKLEVVEQLKTFYFAGHDTTATTIAWATWLLSQHPDVVTKLRTELDRRGIFSNLTQSNASNSSPRRASDSVPTYEAINNCQYLDAVVKETLRLYPPAGSARYTADDNVSFNGMRLDRAVLYVCPYVLHRLKQYWDRPDDFWPERFVGVPAEQYANVYLPFSKGPRDCLGKYFATLEIKLAVAALVQRYETTCVDPNEQIGVQLTAFPKNGAKVSFQFRSIS